MLTWSCSRMQLLLNQAAFLPRCEIATILHNKMDTKLFQRPSATLALLLPLALIVSVFLPNLMYGLISQLSRTLSPTAAGSCFKKNGGKILLGHNTLVVFTSLIEFYLNYLFQSNIFKKKKGKLATT